MSDFPDAFAAIAAGHCPLCSGELVPDEPNGYGGCTACDVGWRIQGVHDPAPEDGTVFGMGPMIATSRKLTADEVRRIYDRS